MPARVFPTCRRRSSPIPISRYGARPARRRCRNIKLDVAQPAERLAGGGPYQFRAAAERTVDSGADLRWGAGRKGYRRLLHPNGICLTGLWEIDADTPYSGYFRKGSRALIVARYSTCCDESRRGHTRSLSMVGKLFPTTDPNHAEPLRTANFITQQDIGGDHTDFINDAEIRNAADVTALRRGSGIWGFLVTGIVFQAVDTMPAMRQLYPIAELGKPADQPTRAPQFMRLLVAADQPRIAGEALDFRDEIMAQIYDRGDPSPKTNTPFPTKKTPTTGNTTAPPPPCPGPSATGGRNPQPPPTAPRRPKNPPTP